MKKYTKTGFSIEIHLQNTDYLVRANILKTDKVSSTYSITLELRRSDIGKWDTLNEEIYSIESDNVNLTVYDFVMDKYNKGFFNRFIDRYEYELVCFEKGNEFFETERFSNVE